MYLHFFQGLRFVEKLLRYETPVGSFHKGTNHQSHPNGGGGGRGAAEVRLCPLCAGKENFQRKNKASICYLATCPPHAHRGRPVGDRRCSSLTVCQEHWQAYAHASEVQTHAIEKTRARVEGGLNAMSMSDVRCQKVPNGKKATETDTISHEFFFANHEGEYQEGQVCLLDGKTYLSTRAAGRPAWTDPARCSSETCSPWCFPPTPARGSTAPRSCIPCIAGCRRRCSHTTEEEEAESRREKKKHSSSCRIGAYNQVGHHRRIVVGVGGGIESRAFFRADVPSRRMRTYHWPHQCMEQPVAKVVYCVPQALSQNLPCVSRTQEDRFCTLICHIIPSSIRLTP